MVKVEIPGKVLPDRAADEISSFFSSAFILLPSALTMELGGSRAICSAFQRPDFNCEPLFCDISSQSYLFLQGHLLEGQSEQKY